jgi:TonB family protein
MFFIAAAFAQSADESPVWGPICRGQASDSAACLTAPHLTYSTEPEYDDASRKAKIEGVVEVQITVTKDGLVRDAKIRRSLCEALDKKAIEAVSQWKFSPATKYGKPVSIYLVTEVDYHVK